MRTNCYIIVAGNRRHSWVEPGAIRLTKNKPPRLAGNEIAVKLSLDIPDGLFLKPTLEASVSIPDSAALGTVITAEVQDNIAQIIKEQTGFNVCVSAPEQVEGKPE